MLVQDELAQALDFIRVTLIQAVGEQSPGGFPLQRTAQRNAFVTGRAEPQREGFRRSGSATPFYQHTFE